MTTVNTKTAKNNIITTLKAGLVPMLAGSPGCGKSDIVKEIAKELGLFVIDHRLSTSDPTDLTGIPAIVDGEGQFLPFNMFPVESTPIPKGYKGWLLFLDEMNSAPMSVQAAAYKLVLDRQVGQHKLHDMCLCVAAGNLATDGAIVNDLGTAMQSRMVHFELEVDPEMWLDWANSSDVDHRVTAYINYAPDKLHQFDPHHNNKTFQCPRTWHFLSKILTVLGDKVSYDDIPVLEGAIGPGAREFLTFCELESELPSHEDIVKNPTKTAIPEEPSVQYFLCGALSSKTEVKDISSVIKYVDRLPIEFQIVCMKDMIKRTPVIKKEACYRAWMSKHAKDLFSN